MSGVQKLMRDNITSNGINEMMILITFFTLWSFYFCALTLDCGHPLNTVHIRTEVNPKDRTSVHLIWKVRSEFSWLLYWSVLNYNFRDVGQGYEKFEHVIVMLFNLIRQYHISKGMIQTFFSLFLSSLHRSFINSNVWTFQTFTFIVIKEGVFF